jgi:probable HAF family extracellular repeat protein
MRADPGFSLRGGWHGASRKQVEQMGYGGSVSQPRNGCDRQHWFFYIDSTFSAIHVPGASDDGASGIKDAGHLVGSFDGEHGFLYANGTFSTTDVPGTIRNGTSDINNAGHIVGSFEDHTGRPHGFLYADSILSTIDVPGALLTEAIGINAAGHITMTSTFR